MASNELPGWAVVDARVERVHSIGQSRSRRQTTIARITKTGQVVTASGERFLPAMLMTDVDGTRFYRKWDPKRKAAISLYPSARDASPAEQES